MASLNDSLKAETKMSGKFAAVGFGGLDVDLKFIVRVGHAPLVEPLVADLGRVFDEGVVRWSIESGGRGSLQCGERRFYRLR
jgi:hypothetical protein